MSDELVDAVRGWLKKRGYPLEYDTARLFRRGGFVVEQGRHWMDRDPWTEAWKPREIDVLVTHAGRDWPTERTGLVAQLVVECKFAVGTWLVLSTEAGTPTPPIEQLLLADQYVQSFVAGTVEVDRPALLRRQLRYGFRIVEMRQKSDRAGEQGREKDALTAYEAIMETTRGAYKIRTAEWPELVIPVIVIDGRLVTVGYDARGREDFEEVESARLIWSGSPLEGPFGMHPQAILVDIVTRSALPQYVKMARELTTAVRRSITKARAAEQKTYKQQRRQQKRR